MTTKQPQPGEWWQKNSTRVCIVGTKKNGLSVGEAQGGNLIPFLAIHDWQHLPDCDSWDWQPEVWPKWYVRQNPETEKVTGNKIAYSKMLSDKSGETFFTDGTSYKWKNNDPKGWIEVTEAEALARVTPVEVFPQYWTTIDKPDWDAAYVMRTSKLEYTIVYKNGETCERMPWNKTDESLRTQLTKEQAEALLPQQPSPKRVSVRLWTHRNALKGSSCRVIAQSRPIDDCNVEIHSDGNGGWYVEAEVQP